MIGNLTVPRQTVTLALALDRIAATTRHACILPKPGSVEAVIVTTKEVADTALVIHGPVAIFALSGVAQDRHAAEQNLIGSAKRTPNTSARRTTFLAISFGKISRRRHCTPIPAARLPRNGLLTNLAKQ